LDLPYELLITTHPDDQHTELEPNNSKETATPIVLGDKVAMQGWIHPSKDEDHYKLDLSSQEKKNYNFEISGIPVIALSVTIFDQAGNEVAKQEKKEDKVGISLLKELDPGVYTIRVKDTRGAKRSNPLNSYALKVSEK
jgi:hypothetical protein